MGLLQDKNLKPSLRENLKFFVAISADILLTYNRRALSVARDDDKGESYFILQQPP